MADWAVPVWCATVLTTTRQLTPAFKREENHDRTWQQHPWEQVQWPQGAVNPKLIDTNRHHLVSSAWRSWGWVAVWRRWLGPTAEHASDTGYLHHNYWQRNRTPHIRLQNLWFSNGFCGQHSSKTRRGSIRQFLLMSRLDHDDIVFS